MEIEFADLEFTDETRTSAIENIRGATCISPFFMDGAGGGQRPLGAKGSSP